MYGSRVDRTGYVKGEKDGPFTDFIDFGVKHDAIGHPLR